MTLPPSGPDVMCIGQARLTAGLDRIERIDLTTHFAVFGTLPRLTADQLIGMTEQVDLRGRGGAAFPFGKKIKSVMQSARQRKKRAVVLVNGTEGEPGSAKDRMLLLRSPCLVMITRSVTTTERIPVTTEAMLTKQSKMQIALKPRMDDSLNALKVVFSCLSPARAFAWSHKSANSAMTGWVRNKAQRVCGMKITRSPKGEERRR